MSADVMDRSLRTLVLDEIYTYLAFVLTVSALPALAISYVVVNVCKKLWLKLLSSRFPHLQFIKTHTVRSLLDTHRNQGIINVLLCVKGTINADVIRSHLIEHVVERKDRFGNYMFPRLKHLLVSCWGNYAWDTNATFQADNHVIIANGVYRGRPITDNNIQDYVSQIISKYFLSDQPPWQYIVIPCSSTEPIYYILVRVHHLLLTGKNSINIGDLLLVEQVKSSEVRQQPTQQSPLVKLFPTPSAIPEFWEKVNEILSNAWNEFVSEYDPVESPRALKTMPGIFHIAGLFLMSSVNATREMTRKNCDANFVGMSSLVSAIGREFKRRDLTLKKTLLSPLVTVDPRKWPKNTFNAAKTITRTMVKMPLWIRDEILALRELQLTGQVKYSNTYTSKYAGITQLGIKAAREALKCALDVYRAPAMLWTDAVQSDDGKKHVLQTVSLCGRKAASWSRPVLRSSIERASRILGVSTTDIALYAATESLRCYFEQTNNSLPQFVLTTARAATEDFLFTFAEGNGKIYQKLQTGGMVCLSLPLGASPRRVASVVEKACDRQGVFAAAWTAQARYGALTRAVPSPFARLTLNLLSRIYSVSYAEINSPPNAGRRNMLWGQSLQTLVYWRPPQANISMSLTVIEYADSVRLAVMTDARLTPGHTIPAMVWPTAIENLIHKIDSEIARITKAKVPRIITVSPVEQPSDEHATEMSSRHLMPPDRGVTPFVRRRSS